jgi:hypothetical protein
MEEVVDGGHAAGEVELAVKPASGADGEVLGEIGPVEAEGELEEKEVQEAAIRMARPEGPACNIFDLVAEGGEEGLDEKPLGGGEEGHIRPLSKCTAHASL